MAGGFEELKRRNVIRVGIAYVVVAWLILQFTDLVLENINAPEWVMQLIMLLLAIGLPVALIFAWAFEMTPEGIKREKDVDRNSSVTPQTGKKLDRIIIGVLVIALAVMVVERTFFAGKEETGVETEIEKTLAVLPFADLSQNGDQEWFADGLAEEILNALSRTPDLLITSRTSSFAYKGTENDVSTIARELGVAHVLEGSVRRAGERIRVTAQLIRAADGFHLWSQNYDRNAADVIDIQEDLALKIANALETTMDPAALAEMVSVGTRSVEAYEAYLRAATLNEKGLATNENQYFLEELESIELAIRLDPEFVLAHRRKAQFWESQLSPTRTSYGVTDLSRVEIRAEFLAGINAAIEITKNPVERALLEAQKANVEMHWSTASRLLRRYLEERPNDSNSWIQYVNIARVSSDSVSGVHGLEQVRMRVGSNVEAASGFMNYAYIFMDPGAAADLGLAWLERWPDNYSLLYQTHRTLMWAMRIEEGATLARSLDQLFPGSRWQDAYSARQACAEGRRSDAIRILQRRRSAGEQSTWIDWQILMLLGEFESAEAVVRAYEDPQIAYPLATWLTYEHFDPGPFPTLVAILDREGIDRPPPISIPFSCPAAG